jgi:hypothetical protein
VVQNNHIYRSRLHCANLETFSWNIGTWEHTANLQSNIYITTRITRYISSNNYWDRSTFYDFGNTALNFIHSTNYSIYKILQTHNITFNHDLFVHTQTCTTSDPQCTRCINKSTSSYQKYKSHLPVSNSHLFSMSSLNWFCFLLQFLNHRYQLSIYLVHLLDFFFHMCDSILTPWNWPHSSAFMLQLPWFHILEGKEDFTYIR